MFVEKTYQYLGKGRVGIQKFHFCFHQVQFQKWQFPTTLSPNSMAGDWPLGEVAFAMDTANKVRGHYLSSSYTAPNLLPGVGLTDVMP